MLTIAHAPLLPVPSEKDDAMHEERRSDSLGRREGDSEFVGHVRAADAGVSVLYRWANMITTIVCCGFMVGVFYTKTNAMSESINALGVKMEASSKATTALEKQVALLEKDVEMSKRETARVTQENVELRGQISEMRGMREAYVYDFGKQAMQGKIQQTIPP